MNRLFFLLRPACLLALIIATLSCSRISNELEGIDRMLFQQPDSALSAIQRIDTEKLYTAELKARYSLLHTMAIDRNGIDTTDYSLLANAVKYYSRERASEDQARMMFYQGRLHYNNKDYPSALQSFLAALKDSDQIDNDWLRGMICTYISLTYSFDHNVKDALEYQQEAYDCFLRFGDDKYINNAKFHLALAYHNNRMFDEADSLYAGIPIDCLNYPSALLGLANNEITKPQPNPDKAISYFKEAINYKVPFYIDQWYQYAYALLVSGDKSASQKLMSKLDGESQDAKSYWWRYKVAKETGDKELALDNLEHYSTESEKYIHSMLSQSSYKAESDYFATLAYHAEQKKIRSYYILAIYILTAIGLLLLVIIIKQRQIMSIQLDREKVETEYYKIKDLVSQLNGELDKKDEDKISSLRSSYISMYRQHFASIGTYIKKDISKSAIPEQIEDHIKVILSELEYGQNNQDRFESRLNKAFDNIMKKLRTDFPDYSSDTYRFLSYIIAGFRNTSIAIILNESTSAISTRKSRLKQKILNSGSPNFDLYKLFLE